MSRYDLLAIDLDGTLLSPLGEVSEANRHAIARAKSAGVRVSICTGRGYNECKGIARAIGQTDPVVVAGGAILSEAATGETLHRFPMDRGLVARLVETLTGHGHAALILKDPCGTREHGLRPGHDYVVVSPRGEEGIDPVTRWWFAHHGIGVKVVPDLSQDEHPEHTVRVGVCGTRRETGAAARDMQDGFAGEVTFHHFQAVIPGSQHDSADDQIVILEAFDRRVSKWTAIEWLALREGIDPSRIAAIGNDVNDVAMLRGAGLSIAMGNAIAEAKAAAIRETLDNESDGVAHAIERILAGDW